LSDTEFVESASGEKISDCLLAVLGDLVDKVATEEEMGKLVKLASIAWNASLLPEQERADFLQSSAMQDVYVDVKNLIELLIRRKLLLFPEVRRYILDVQVAVVDDSLHISAASADLR
jgi:hypothetical protein